MGVKALEKNQIDIGDYPKFINFILQDRLNRYNFELEKQLLAEYSAAIEENGNIITFDDPDLQLEFKLQWS